MSTKKQQPQHTSKLNAEQRRALTIPLFGGFGARFLPENLIFHPAPYNYQTLQNPNHWRILMKFSQPGRRPMNFGLDIYGDVILGRGSEGPNAPDVDFSNLDAVRLGVSRRHALLRPTQNRLFLIDLESTNGTTLNAIPVGKGMAQRIKSGDLIAMGGLSFVVDILQTPQGAPEATVDEVEGGEKRDDTEPGRASPILTIGSDDDSGTT